MAFINLKRQKPAKAGKHLNYMAGPSYDIQDPLLRLRVAASSCFFGEPMYYQRDARDKRPNRSQARYAARLTDEMVTHLRLTLNAIDPQAWRGLSPAQLMERAIDEALAHDAEATLAYAAELRNVEHIRTTPQVILVRAAQRPEVKGTGLIAKYAPRIIRRADEPAVGLAYQLATFGRKGIPMALRKAWKQSLETFSPYELAKYRLAGRGVKTVDVVNLTHPQSEAVDALVKGELTVTDQTWEAIVSQGGSTREAWAKAIDVMGHMALLRNVRNLLGKGLEPALFVEKLVAGAEKGKQLPFRYWAAYQAVQAAGVGNGQVLDAIETCLMRSIGNLPRFKGRTMSLVDNSGSAHGAFTSAMGSVAVNVIGNLTGVLTGMASDDGYVGVVGDGLKSFAVRKHASAFDQLEKANRLGQGIGHATENGVWLFWDQAIRDKEHWDQVFIYSDMQAGHGGLYGTNPKAYKDFKWMGSNHIDVPALIAEYRRTVNPDVQVFLVQIAGYQDVLVPEFYDKTYILGGWSDAVLRFAAKMIDLTSKAPSQDGGADRLA
jgi:hypothetical protein